MSIVTLTGVGKEERNGGTEDWLCISCTLNVTVKSRAVAVSVSTTVLDFQKAYEGEIQCLCIVTFGQNIPKLNSRPVYCSQLYCVSKGNLFDALHM